MRTVVILIASFVAVSVSGCNGMRKVSNSALPGQPFEARQKMACKQSNKDYVGAKEMPPLKAPDGLEPPDTRNALKVPVLQSSERVRGRDEACLDAPPPVSTTKTAPAPTPAPPPKQPREVPTQ